MFLLGVLLFNYPLLALFNRAASAVRHPAALRLHLRARGHCSSGCWRSSSSARASATPGTGSERHAAELGDHPGRARLPRRAVRHRLLRRPPGGPGPLDHRQSVHLRAVARRLRDGVDVLRQRRARRDRRRRLPADLHRPDADDGAVVARDAQDHPHQQGQPHHVARRLHLVALRQERAARRARHDHRRDRGHSVHRPAAEGGRPTASRFSSSIRRSRCPRSASRCRSWPTRRSGWRCCWPPSRSCSARATSTLPSATRAWWPRSHSSRW